MFAAIEMKKIMMTKAESKNAGKPNTSEYNTLMELKKSFPDFQIEIVKSSTKKADRFKGLDYDYMKKYIEDHDKTKLETFYELRGLDKDGKKVEMAIAASFGEIKMWFLAEFPEIEKLSENVNKIIEAARQKRAERKAG